MTRKKSLLFALAFGLFCSDALWLAAPQSGMNAAAWADDDDDGDDDDDDRRDDDDDDDDRRAKPTGNRGSGFKLFAPRAPQAAPVRPAAPPPAPDFAPNELITLALSETDLAALTAQGFVVLDAVTLPGLSATPRRLSIPADLTLTAARDTVRALPSGRDADFNHFYRSEQGLASGCSGSECSARQMIDWPIPDSRFDFCGNSVAIGMVDTGINATHETFEGARLDVTRLGDNGVTLSNLLHGTAVAALLVGGPATRSPGLVPGAQLVAVDAFYRRGGDERADVFTLVRALSHLADAGVQVINLSLAGPDNTVLAEVVERLVLVQDIALIAAVGNSGPRAAPEYPAAYDLVIAVTAVDRDGAVYRRAIQGPHVDIAAPGVDVWTAASISGARWKTGTSFAVPFVTAAAAILRESRPELRAAEIAAVLGENAVDLGDPGLDPVYGAGLLRIDGLCEDPA